ncbi:MAG: thiamine phosphate synthase [Planctomycetes bacterium]|nr:thiamine phosphate synthase [Planctomycetota bacterium]
MFALPPLVALSPGNLNAQAAGEFLARVERAVAGGLECVLLREHELSERAFLELGAQLRRRVRHLIVHDRVHLARLLEADAVQLGFRSLPPREARALLGEGLPIGFSAHAHDAPEARAGADFLLVGPVLRTPSKEGLLEPLQFEGLARELERDRRPAWALGGLRPEHAAQVRERGAQGMAVLAGVLGSADPQIAARAYLDAWERAR